MKRKRKSWCNSSTISFTVPNSKGRITMLPNMFLKWLLCFGGVFALLLSFWGVAECFNLDPRIPVIKRGGADDESYFGYSVAQHRTVKGSRGQPLILVGAPRDNNLQPGTYRSGALWQCKMNNDIEVRKQKS